MRFSTPDNSVWSDLRGGDGRRPGVCVHQAHNELHSTPHCSTVCGVSSTGKDSHFLNITAFKKVRIALQLLYK